MNVTVIRHKIATDAELRRLAGDQGVKALLDLNDDKLAKLCDIVQSARG